MIYIKIAELPRVRAFDHRVPISSLTRKEIEAIMIYLGKGEHAHTYEELHQNDEKNVR